MEPITTILNIIAENFWQLLLIAVMIKYKRDWGIVLLLSHVVLGYNLWMYLAIGTIGAFSKDTSIRRTVRRKWNSVMNTPVPPKNDPTDPDFK